MTHTHTFATLEISRSAFDEIKAKLEAAGYQDQFQKDGNTLLIDMHGIAVHGSNVPDEAVAQRRIVCNVAMMHFGQNDEIEKINADAEAGKISNVEAIRAAMEIHLKLARTNKRHLLSMANVDGGSLPGASREQLLERLWSAMKDDTNKSMGYNPAVHEACERLRKMEKQNG